MAIGIMPILSGNDASMPMEQEGLVNVRVQRTSFKVVNLFGWYGAAPPDCLEHVLNYADSLK